MDMFEMFEDYAKEQEKEEPKEPVSNSSYSSYAPQNSMDSSKLIVISVGGSLFFKGKPDSAGIAKFASSINELRQRGYSFVLVCGGGETARNYVSAGKALGANNFELDEIGINVTRLNAQVLTNSLDNAYPSVLTEVKQAKKALLQGKIPVFGGLLPSFTTDAVSALIAEYLNASVLVNLTNVDGVYSMDPKEHSHAKYFNNLSYDKLISLMKLAESKPGQHMVLDLPCCLIIKRSKIKTIVMDGNDLENFKSMIIGMDFKGTIISSEAKEE
ncbi:MAG: UMP kinase [Candidatus Diapherotrites archaeon]|nr:UMP kinase [Candidatus Diapherotrites archaeon]